MLIDPWMVVDNIVVIKINYGRKEKDRTTQANAKKGKANSKRIGKRTVGVE